MDPLVFRYLPGFLPLSVGVAIFLLYGLYLGITHPSFLSSLTSPKVIFLLALMILGIVIMWVLLVKLWRTNWRFHVTSSHLIAVHVLRRQRIQIPWEQIARVTKLPRWERGGLSFSQIETTDGQKIPFGTNLMGYKRFLQELKTRATACKVFDAYADEWDRR
jgi:hypothetical protein